MATDAFSKLIRLFSKTILLVIGCFLALGLVGCQNQASGLLNPKGIIAFQERKLFFDTLALMLIVVLPVIVMSFAFVYHYLASHKVRDYKPNWSHSYQLESLWWGIPCVIIVILAVLTWKKTHELDPYQKIAGTTEPPLLIQAIALPWKWLFIYPEQNIASINYLVIPQNRDIEFWITADNVPMSALFIPQLGSQIYAMAGMRTKMHILANHTGTFEGLNTQYNGDGFSDMHFTVQVIEPEKMQSWVSSTQVSKVALSQAAYLQLLNPSIGDKPRFFVGVEPNLFQNTINTYMNTMGPVHPRNMPAKFSAMPTM